MVHIDLGAWINLVDYNIIFNRYLEPQAEMHKEQHRSKSSPDSSPDSSAISVLDQ